MGKQNLKVSVIICAYTMGRFDDVKEAVDSVLYQTLKPYEVIIAVDHNKELYIKLRHELPSEVKMVLNTGTQGFSATKNVAIRAVNGDIIVFLDDDAVAEETWLENIIPPFEDSKVMAVGGQTIALWAKGKPPFWFPEEFDFIVGCTVHKKLILQENGEVRNFGGGNSAIRKEVFKEVGFWETRLGRSELGRVRFNPAGGEEAELCLRMKTTIPDGLILFRPESVVYHKVSRDRATFKYVFSFCFREGITRAMIRKFVSQYRQKPLAAEYLFLRRLLSTSLPQKLRNFYKSANLAQVAVIIANLSLIGTGYLLGRWRYR
jgi:cellulose synthase/poly-beta-1,6-N-acetylglucosamine synthase-like glycosyltransferase